MGKFFLGREVPRDPLVFMIRCMGGEASWCSTAASGSTYTEDDDRVTHQIADRDVIANKKLGRFYVQPQWIFDSINRRKRFNEKDYALGETLPPHLSPFIADRRIGDYVPPEEKALEAEAEKENKQEEDEKEEEEEDEDMEDEEEAEDEGDEGEEEKVSEVKEGTKEKVDKVAAKKMTEEEEFRLREMMVPRKHRGLYRSMMKGRKKRANQAKYLEKKRKHFDEQKAAEALPQKKKAKKTKTASAE